MTADLPPRRPGSSERLRHLVFGQLLAAGDRHHCPQAGLPAGLEEVSELRLLVAHNLLTLPAANLNTCEQNLPDGTLMRGGTRAVDRFEG
jgi:hypothetical protein